MTRDQVGAIFGLTWGVVLLGAAALSGRPAAAEPAASIAALETSAREACEAQGLTLRALLVAYDVTGAPVAGRAACGEPRRSKA